ncbi:pantetheine-phosphate adenylyltransferase [Microlunatus speluncae]|uniref:pantetheine-phosphate adenylyltransferase n=1 Tax=Microlunatus speluncae TaxID=2594267 RepID=UPI0012661C48|nr:pantetheine-phosphate adenylyltransferase [Microlunatus speluncae]
MDQVQKPAVRRAVCPGSYDPITLGHLDVITRAAGLFDEVLVAVGINPDKRGRFTGAERVQLITESCRELPNVAAIEFTGLLVDLCVDREIGTIVKGVRTAADSTYEFPMAQMNRRLKGIDTILVPSAPEWSFVSSSLVREIAGHGGDVTPFVPQPVAERLA